MKMRFVRDEFSKVVAIFLVIRETHSYSLHAWQGLPFFLRDHIEVPPIMLIV